MKVLVDECLPLDSRQLEDLLPLAVRILLALDEMQPGSVTFVS